ncbi:MAG: hypothetical protein NC400_00180 [Clostridium sp.]|nr:hypothetical protein [Clostridium sp.]
MQTLGDCFEVYLLFEKELIPAIIFMWKVRHRIYLENTLGYLSILFGYHFRYHC